MDRIDAINSYDGSKDTCLDVIPLDDTTKTFSLFLNAALPFFPKSASAMVLIDDVASTL